MNKSGWFGPVSYSKFKFLPKSIEGWIATLIFFVALFVAGRLGLLNDEYESLIFFVILGIYMAVVYLTYDSHS